MELTGEKLQAGHGKQHAGKNTGQAGWTPLHLASYFGLQSVAEGLMKVGADVNVQNDAGDTPLHLAALTGRKELVLLLLRYGACATVINRTAQTPRDVTEDDEAITMLEAAERREERKVEERLFDVTREGNHTAVTQLLTKYRPPDIHCKDSQGNTPLHTAACRGHQQCVDILLKAGANPSAKNKAGQSVLDVAKDDEIRILLERSQEMGAANRPKKFEGLLLKKLNFMSWNFHWVVVENGSISWFDNKSDAVCGGVRQGFQPLLKSQCVVKAWDKYFFTLRCCDGSEHQFRVSPRCRDPDCTRKKWLDAIKEHSAYSALCGGLEKAHVEAKEEEAADLGDLSDSLQGAEVYLQNLESQVAVFVSMVKQEDNSNMTAPELLKAREICELCSETSSVLRHCLDQLSEREELWKVKLEQEVEKNKILSEALQTLATERYRLKQALSVGRKSPTPSTITEDEDEFYDAVSGE